MLVSKTYLFEALLVYIVDLDLEIQQWENKFVEEEKYSNFLLIINVKIPIQKPFQLLSYWIDHSLSNKTSAGNLRN